MFQPVSKAGLDGSTRMVVVVMVMVEVEVVRDWPNTRFLVAIISQPVMQNQIYHRIPSPDVDAL